ncbi:hypothetical protein HZR84_04210 [Hyphobacterium sp. CCMP332]|nr:hypothetical protein HZR84_04210 [Hyphobacterium sp. CCMP332]
MSVKSSGSADEFEKLSSDEWWYKIDKDLKGKPREILNRNLVEDLITEPFYHFDQDSANNKLFEYQERDQIFLDGEAWLLGQKFFIAEGNEKDVSELISESIGGDCNLIELSFENEFEYSLISKVLDNFKGKLILSSNNSSSLLRAYDFLCAKLNNEIILDPDYLSAIAKGDFKTFLSSKTFHDSIIALNSNFLIRKGGNEIHEGIYILSLLNLLIESSLELNIRPKYLLRLNTGSNFFLQIAKFRVIRKLASIILKEWGIDSIPIIEAQSTEWNKSVYDRFTNILRLSSESFAAISGGVDILNISGFEKALDIENAFTFRNARNISHLLKHESHLDKVNDQAAGSYYVEKLSADYSEKVWEGFQEIESKGGLIKYNSDFSVEKILAEVKTNVESQFGNKRIKMVGTNSYPNPLDELTKENIQNRTKERLAYKFEKLRASVDLRNLERQRKRPKVLLLKLGNSEMRFARAGFSTNFLECAGLEIDESDKIDNRLTNFDITVICSGDDEYMESGTSWAEEIKTVKPKIKLILAGNPENKKDLEKAGVDFFIHIKAPLENTLVEILKSLGIE